MSILRSLERRGADGSLPWGTSVIPTNMQTGLVSAGIAINDDVALSLTTVGSCISLLSDGISTLPLQGLKKTKDRSKKLLDPTPPLIDNPWPEGTRQDFFTQVMVSLLLRGNFYGQIVDRDSGGYATMIMPIHPDRIMARRDTNTGKRTYKASGQPIPLDDMVHIPALLVPGSFIGLNPVEYQRSPWALAAATERYGSQFFANSANPSGVIEVPGTLAPEEALEMAREWKMMHGGLGMASQPAIFTDGATWKTISVAPDDAQFLQTRQFQQQQIISWFRIPPHKIGVTDRSPGPTLTEELEMMYVQDALLPWAVRIEQYFSDLLRPSQTCKFDFASRLRGNTLARAQAAQIWANIGENTLDELRALEDREPLPNGLGNVIARPANMAYWDVATGKQIASPSANVGAVNPGGLGDGGGDPNNAPGPTQPDQ